jgi:phosphoglycolate phosphatase-like HAD superfamily hydrolase
MGGWPLVGIVQPIPAPAFTQGIRDVAGFAGKGVSSGTAHSEEYKIGGLFHHVRTMDQYSVRKPDPRALLSLLVESETAPHEAIYVGDAVEDIQMGRGAGTYTLAVPSAFVSKDTLITAQPDFLVECLAGILEILPKKTVSKGAR